MFLPTTSDLQETQIKSIFLFRLNSLLVLIMINVEIISSNTHIY